MTAVSAEERRRGDSGAIFVLNHERYMYELQRDVIQGDWQRHRSNQKEFEAFARFKGCGSCKLLRDRKRR